MKDNVKYHTCRVGKISKKKNLSNSHNKSSKTQKKKKSLFIIFYTLVIFFKTSFILIQTLKTSIQNFILFPFTLCHAAICTVKYKFLLLYPQNELKMFGDCVNIEKYILIIE